MGVSFICRSSHRYTIDGANCLTGKCCQARLEEQRSACLELQRQAEATHERKAGRFVLTSVLGSFSQEGCLSFNELSVELLLLGIAFFWGEGKERSTSTFRHISLSIARRVTSPVIHMAFEFLLWYPQIKQQLQGSEAFKEGQESSR